MFKATITWADGEERIIKAATLRLAIETAYDEIANTAREMDNLVIENLE